MVDNPVLSRRGRIVSAAVFSVALGATLAVFAIASRPAGAEPFSVEMRQIDDLKAVFGTVESVDTVVARARIGGTIKRNVRIA